MSVEIVNGTNNCVASGLDDRRAPSKGKGLAATISSNIVASLARVVVVSLVGLALPAYLTQHLPVQTYAAWILILQLAAYVSYLDLGIQTGVAKFVAEHHARQDIHTASRYASAGLALAMLTATSGLGLTLVLAWQVPRLFGAMPSALYRDVRLSVLLVGTSLSFTLICAVYSGVFLGLQRYWVPMTLSIVNRVLFAASVLTVVAMRGSLTAMALAVSFINVLTGLLQLTWWRKAAFQIRISLRLLNSAVLTRMARYCLLQSVWILGMLFVTGLDLTIVGRYDYMQTGYYSVAILPTSFLLLIISSIVNPLMPAASAMSTWRSPLEMAQVLTRATRYTTAALLLTGLPLLVFGLPLLRLWVGADYASHTLPYLRILVIANILRNLGAPYAAMIGATGRQGAATSAVVAESVVNLGSSIYLASRFGAIGVAIGTLLGSAVSMIVHFVITMPLTQQTIAIRRWELLRKSLLQPAATAIPSLLLLRLWWTSTDAFLSPGLAASWIAGTLALTWFCALTAEERNGLIRQSRRWPISPLSPY